MFIMGRLTAQNKGPSGQDIKTYTYKGFRLEILPYFLYEICINKYWKGGFCTLESKFLKSDKPLKVKVFNQFKYGESFLIEKSITMLGAPYSFIRENNLPEFQLNNKKKKLKKK